jgi:ABC-2 type transport system ATP-binding protein
MTEPGSQQEVRPTAEGASEALLEIRGVTRCFGSLHVLAGVDLVLPAGQAAAVIGPNGSGKTTLLRCVVGADAPDEGEIRFDGRIASESDPQFRAAVASLLDDIGFFPDVSVCEHLELLARAHGMPDPAGEVAATLDELGLEGAADQLPITLSTGQRHRLALASCLVRARRLLVLDEPEQRLDTAGREWLGQRLRNEKAAGRAILMASHDQELIELISDLTIEIGR